MSITKINADVMDMGDAYAFTGAVSGAGKVLQVVQVSETGTGSWSGTALPADTGLQLAITPSSSSSKVLIMYLINIGYTASINQWNLHIDRSGTEINLGAADGARKRANAQPNNYASLHPNYMTTSMSGMFLDSPSSTSALTYKIQQSGATDSGTFYLNRSNADRTNTGYDSRLVSNLILMEVS